MLDETNLEIAGQLRVATHGKFLLFPVTAVAVDATVESLQRLG